MHDHSDLDSRLDALSRTPVLLVASDYDGVLAPIVDDPSNAPPHAASVAALAGLAELPDTHVAVVSGRARDDLASLGSFPPSIHLVGSHGSEFEDGIDGGLSDDQLEALDHVGQLIERLVASHNGFVTERKPAGIAFHYRSADPELAVGIVQQLRAEATAIPGVHLKEGKMVLDVGVVDANKGTAIDQLRSAFHADAVIFLGDDVTDEDGFLALTPNDVGVKIGEGTTAASVRIDTTDDATEVLQRLFNDRTAFLQPAQP